MKWILVIQQQHSNIVQKIYLKFVKTKIKFSNRFFFNILKLAHDYVNRLGKHEIAANDIDLVMNADTVEIV